MQARQKQTFQCMSALLWMVVLVVTASTDIWCDSADSVYEVADADTAWTPPTEMIRTLRRLLHECPDSASAHYALGKLYMQQRTIEGRYWARRAFRNAVRLDSGNVEYELAFGQVLLAQGYRQNAERAFKQVAAAHPQSAEAAYLAGNCALERFLGSATGRPVQPESYLGKDLELALSCMSRCIELDPDYRDAYYRLGLVYHELAQPDSLIEVARHLLARYPGDKEAELFCGIGHLMKGEIKKADEAFSRGLAGVDYEERKAMESVDPIAGGLRVGQLARPSFTMQEGKARVVWDDRPEGVRFWRERDPLYLTEFNERRLEHYSRVAYAILRFSSVADDIQGWETDMGRTYIRFGRPIHKQAGSPKVVDGEYASGTRTWVYEGFSIGFVLCGGGEWCFARGSVLPGMGPGMSSSDYFRRIMARRHELSRPPTREVFKKTEPRFLDPFRLVKYSMPYQIAAFRDGDSIRVELSYALPRARLREPDSDEAVRVEDGLFLFDEHWEEVCRDVRAGSFEADLGPRQTQSDSARRSHLLATKRLRLEPGRYHLVVETWSQATGAIGELRVLRSYSYADSALLMSDLLLASQIEPLDASPRDREDLKIVPNPLHTFRQSEPVFIYLEIYNLTQDAFDRTAYEITYRLGRPTKKEGDPRRFVALDLAQPTGRVVVDGLPEEQFSELAEDETWMKPWLDKDYGVSYVFPEKDRITRLIEEMTPRGGSTERSVTAQYEGDRRNDLTYLEIDITRMPIGLHKLTVTVRDVQTGQTDEREAVFRVTN